MLTYFIIGPISQILSLEGTHCGDESQDLNFTSELEFLLQQLIKRLTSEQAS